MRLRYCLIYLVDVMLGHHGWLTPRQIYGDCCSIWVALPVDWLGGGKR